MLLVFRKLLNPTQLARYSERSAVSARDVQANIVVYATQIVHSYIISVATSKAVFARDLIEGDRRFVSLTRYHTVIVFVGYITYSLPESNAIPLHAEALI